MYIIIAAGVTVVGVYLVARAVYVKMNLAKIKENIKLRREERVKETEAYYSGNGKHELKGEDLESLKRLSKLEYIRYLELINVQVPDFFKRRVYYQEYCSKEEFDKFKEFVTWRRYPITKNVRQFLEEGEKAYYT